MSPLISITITIIITKYIQLWQELPISGGNKIYTHYEKSSSNDQTDLPTPPHHGSSAERLQPLILKTHRVSPDSGSI